MLIVVFLSAQLTILNSFFFKFLTFNIQFYTNKYINIESKIFRESHIYYLMQKCFLVYMKFRCVDMKDTIGPSGSSNDRKLTGVSEFIQCILYFFAGLLIQPGQSHVKKL